MGVFVPVTAARQKPLQMRFRIHGDGPRHTRTNRAKLTFTRHMTHVQDIEKLEATLWEAADNLRANSHKSSSEYCMPVLGVIFLRHATNRYDAACHEIAQEQAAGKMPNRPLNKADFLKRRALMLPKEARYDELMRLPKGEDFGAALVSAMNAIYRA